MNEYDKLTYRAHLAGACFEPCPVCDEEVQIAVSLMGYPKKWKEWVDSFEEEVKLNLCLLPPPGWWCSRDPGHKDPCAARPI